MDYETDILIDEQALDVEWLDQSRLMGRYCENAAALNKAMGLAEEELNFVKSTLARDVRADPAKFGVVPGSRGITEESIKAAIRVCDDYRRASRAFIDARYEYEVAVGTVRAFDTRKRALENLVTLHGQNYFAGPRVPHDIGQERARRDREAQGRVRLSSALPHSATNIPPPSPKRMIHRRSD